MGQSNCSAGQKASLPFQAVTKPEQKKLNALGISTLQQRSAHPQNDTSQVTRGDEGATDHGFMTLEKIDHNSPIRKTEKPRSAPDSAGDKC